MELRYFGSLSFLLRQPRDMSSFRIGHIGARPMEQGRMIRSQRDARIMYHPVTVRSRLSVGPLIEVKFRSDPAVLETSRSKAWGGGCSHAPHEVDRRLVIHRVHIHLKSGGARGVEYRKASMRSGVTSHMGQMQIWGVIAGVSWL